MSPTEPGAADAELPPVGRDANGAPDARWRAGRHVREEVAGADHVQRTDAGGTDFNQPFTDYITATVWGGIWTRPGLDRRTRSAITLAVLTTLRAHDELELHVRGALANGLTPEEIREILLHTGGYAGVPAANAATAIAGRVLAEAGESIATRPATGTADQDDAS